MTRLEIGVSQSQEVNRTVDTLFQTPNALITNRFISVGLFIYLGVGLLNFYGFWAIEVICGAKVGCVHLTSCIISPSPSFSFFILVTMIGIHKPFQYHSLHQCLIPSTTVLVMASY